MSQTKLHRSSQVLRSIVEKTADSTGSAFFSTLARELAKALEVRYCFLTECLDTPPTRVRTLAFWDGLQQLESFEYDLAGTPCQQVMAGEECTFGRQIQQLFPDDHDLVDLEAESYAALPMLGSGGRVLGHLAVLDVEPFTDREPDLSILRIFAARAAAELERLRLERQVLRSQKMEAMGELASGLAHNFNNMLTAIVGYGELILQRLPPGDPIQPDCEEILKAARQAARLTEELTSLSRRQIVQHRPVDLNRLVRGTESMLRQLVGEGIDWSTRLAGDLHTVSADPGQIEQVLVNLVVNARDAMAGRGRLSLETRNLELASGSPLLGSKLDAGRYVCLSVSDDGPGIPPATRARVFEPFFTTKKTGSGLGLSTVDAIARQAGGRVTIECPPTGGTTLHVLLPVTDLPQAPREHAPSRPSRGETLLITEDRPEIRLLIERVLERDGYRVLSASGAENALEIAAAHGGGIDLLITDIFMPGQSGWQLAERWLERWPSTRVLYISGNADEVSLPTLEHAEVNFLKKPFSGPQLSLKVREVLDQPLTAGRDAGASPTASCD